MNTLLDLDSLNAAQSTQMLNRLGKTKKTSHRTSGGGAAHYDTPLPLCSIQPLV